MKASELRIGNWVQGSNDPDVVVSSIEVDGSIQTRFYGADEDYGDWYYQEGEFKSIPLTKEWLIKFGFENVQKVVPDLDEFIDGLWNNDVVIRQNPGNGLFYSTSEIVKDYTVGLPIYNVHQLQNLYFALTNEELTIKESKKFKPDLAVIYLRSLI